ncbi:hypothetical protein [Pararhodobacter sp.]|uniref:hypothetical protein n=1 Tax=Pararhodobacter sp. TaxID=2127056 RepID=UPI002AFFAC13|nr:hypothetical protein [Pararhodobacter sp.]
MSDTETIEDFLKKFPSATKSQKDVAYTLGLVSAINANLAKTQKAMAEILLDKSDDALRTLKESMDKTVLITKDIQGWADHALGKSVKNNEQ